MSIRARAFGMLVLAAGLLTNAGCPGVVDSDDLEDLLEEAADTINSVIDNIQERNPFVGPPGVDLGGAGVILDGTSNTIFIEEFRRDVDPASIRNSTFIAFTNITGFDIAVEYDVTLGNLILQETVYVYDGESVLLQYDCADFIDILAEYDFDIFTGAFVQDFVFQDFFAERDVEFFCGELVEFTFTPDAVEQTVDRVSLYR